MLALGQYLSARKSVEAFHDSGYTGWTITHAFYADMGGFTFQPRGWKSFPVNSKELHYLVTKGYLPFPEVTKEHIQDKDKASGLARLITIVQILWFTLAVIMRSVQHLAITTLEITTVAFIFCSLATAACWRHKPMDVETSIILESNFTIEEILLNAGEKASTPYRYTPMDFIDRKEWITYVIWTYCINVLRHMNLVYHSRPKRPINRISPFRYAEVPGTILVIFALFYAAIFFCSWNFHLPSERERLFWRVSCIFNIALCAFGALFLGVFGSAVNESAKKNERKPQKCSMSEKTTHLPPPVTARQARDLVRDGASYAKRLITHIRLALRNNSPDKDPEFDVPFRTLILSTPVCVMYAIFRIFVLIEDVISLRELPSSTFQTVEWSRYWPHL
ncbi:hypothetical protein McanMca71_007775 [Microsporum canis]